MPCSSWSITYSAEARFNDVEFGKWCFNSCWFCGKFYVDERSGYRRLMISNVNSVLGDGLLNDGVWSQVMNLTGAVAVASQLGNLALSMVNAYRRSFCRVEIRCPGGGKVVAACDYAIKHTDEIMRACSISRTLGVQATATRINTPRTLKWV